MAGADEAGRGCLAGPLVAAAVVLRADRITAGDRRALGGLDDSKRVEREERERLFARLLVCAERVSVCVIHPRTIDRIGLHRSNLRALQNALEQVQDGDAQTHPSPRSDLPDGASGPGAGSGESRAVVSGQPVAVNLVDGYPLADCELPHTCVIGGDGKSAAVAAASVIAKVSRDRLMRRADDRFPGWGFAEHVGYGTAEHLAAIERHGVSPLHRLSFNCAAYNGNGAAAHPSP